MTSESRLRVLFTGYAPVHFVCFRPMYQRLLQMSNVDVSLSGGLRTKAKGSVVYDESALYEPFGIDPDLILPTEELSDQSFDVLFAANTKMIAPRHVDARIQIFHGISFRNKAVRPDNMNADYYFMVGPYMRRRFVDRGLMTSDDPRALNIGFMKTDGLLNGDFDRGELLSQFGFDGSRPIVLYAPTGQKHNSLETMGEDVITQIAQSGAYDLIIKPHDHPKNTKINWRKRLKKIAGSHVRITRELDVVPLLFLADLLMTDASSVSSEYSLLDRPILFLDVPRLIDRASSSAGSQIDLDSWGRHCGPIVESASDVVQTIDALLEHPQHYGSIRQEMAKDLFFNPGTATDEAEQWFRKTFLQSPNSVRYHDPSSTQQEQRAPTAPSIQFSDPATQHRERHVVNLHPTETGE